MADAGFIARSADWKMFLKDAFAPNLAKDRKLCYGRSTNNVEKGKYIMIVDLHTHSTASDGQYTPSELVRLAKDRGLEVLALTDHDTVGGLEEAAQAGDALGLRVLRGIELSAREYRSLHILGYGVSTAPSALTRLCAEMKDGRDQRKYRIIDFLHEKGVDISLAEVEELAGGDVIGRPHFAQIMVRRGWVESSREAFDRYLDTDEYQSIERKKPDARACIEAICSAGGHAALAHPYQMRLEDGPLEELVKALAGWGLEAIECLYPRHTAEQQAFYLRMAKKYGLHVTGGSDFHGERVKPDVVLAALGLDVDWLLGE